MARVSGSKELLALVNFDRWVEASNETFYAGILVCRRGCSEHSGTCPRAVGVWQEGRAKGCSVIIVTEKGSLLSSQDPRPDGGAGSCVMD